MKLKKSALYLTAILILIATTGAFVFLNNPKSANTSDQNSQENLNQNSDVQKIVLGYKYGNYYPNTIKVKANQPVEISLDSNVKGCYRSFTISSFGLRKYLQTPSDTLVFTPTQKGTFTFACSMRMGTGNLIVE